MEGITACFTAEADGLVGEAGVATLTGEATFAGEAGAVGLTGEVGLRGECGAVTLTGECGAAECGAAAFKGEAAFTGDTTAALSGAVGCAVGEVTFEGEFGVVIFSEKRRRERVLQKSKKNGIFYYLFKGFMHKVSIRRDQAKSHEFRR